MTNVQELRKIYSAQGVKGASSWNRAKFNEHIEAAHELALLSEASRESAKQVKPVSRKREDMKGICDECGEETLGADDLARHTELAHTVPAAVVEEAQAARAEGIDPAEVLSDEGLAILAEVEAKPVPGKVEEIDGKSKVNGRSRRGMKIVAKGTELHKSETFRVAAEAAGWSCEVLGSVTEPQIDEETGEEYEVEVYVAIAKRGDDSIELAWEGRAYNYPESGAFLGGKARKVRNLKEALRFLVR